MAPVEPTVEMANAAATRDFEDGNNLAFYGLIYKSMLSAAPTPQYQGIMPDQDHIVALAVAGKLSEEQTREILTKAFPHLAPTPPDSSCGVTEEWELPSTPPEVEPVLFVNGSSLEREDCPSTQSYRDEYFDTALFTSPPSPKAEEVEVVYEVWRGAEIGFVRVNEQSYERLKKNGHEVRETNLTECCAPKASWDAEGNPLNLEAAARIAYFAIKVEHGTEHPACVHLRKFLKN